MFLKSYAIITLKDYSTGMYFELILLMGLVVGVISHVCLPAKGGLLGSLILGMLGALEGGFFKSLALGGYVVYFDSASIILAMAGAVLLVLLQRTSLHYSFIE